MNILGFCTYKAISSRVSLKKFFKYLANVGYDKFIQVYQDYHLYCLNITLLIKRLIPEDKSLLHYQDYYNIHIF